MKISTKSILAIGCACCAMAAVTPAAAKNAANADAEPGATTPGSPDSGHLEEIIVTAQRRAQRSQDVPVAISAVSADGLARAGITGTADLQVAVPSLNITRNANGALTFLRGVGSSIGDINAENSVAIYIDGVYHPTYVANYLEFNDVERIEVLKGPQGTLFGRNATGGVIQVITKDPGKDLTGSFAAGYANFNTVDLNGYISAPLTNNLGFSTSVYYENRHDGYGENIFTGMRNRGAEQVSVRSKLVYSPGADTKITVAGSYAHSLDGGLEAQQVNLRNSTFALPFPGKYNTDNNFSNFSRVTSYNGSLTIDQKFDSFSLKSITAYENVKGTWDLDFDASPIDIVDSDIHQKSTMISQELHILSPAHSKIQWLVGGFLYHRIAGELPAALPTPGISVYGETKVNSESLFGQATYPLGGGTSITAGARYAWDSSKAVADTTLYNTNIIIDTPNGQPAHNRVSYSKPTWRLALDHKFTPDIMGYVSYNRGMKSGNFGLGGGAAGIAKPYLPEQLDAYEIGLKTELFDRRVRFNVGGFYYDFKNLQIQKYISGSAFVFNGPSAKIYGGEVELEARATDNLTLTANVGLLHSQYGNFPAGPSSPVNTCLTPSGFSDAGGYMCDPTTHFATSVPFNGKGLPLVFAPNATGNVGFSYTYPTTFGNFMLNGNVYHVSSASGEIGDRLRNPSYTLLNASLVWKDASARYSVKVWAKNLTNAYYYAQIATAPGLNDIGGAAPPRTFGVTAGYKF